MREYIERIQYLITLVLTIVSAAAFGQFKIVGYVPNEGDLIMIDYSRVTHVNIAFINPVNSEGTLSFTGWQGNSVPLKTKYVQDAHYHGRKVLASMAGGSASENAAMRERYFSLISDKNRTAFVAKIVAFVKANALDGIDVDLEGPAINADYGEFIAELAKAIHAEGKLITAALSHLNGGKNVSDETLNFFDFLNIMAYDKTGPWNPSTPGQHSSYEFAEESLKYWADRGLSKSKCILGVPFYGYSFGVSSTSYTYATIVDTYPDSENSDQVSSNGNTIYYNGMTTIKQKAQYIVDNDYGGVMIWHLGQDKPSSNEKSLLKALADVVTLPPIVLDAEVKQKDVVEFFPNPASSLLTIKAGDENRTGTIEIIDYCGKSILILPMQEVVDISALAVGTYILIFTDRFGFSAHARLIKR